MRANSTDHFRATLALLAAGCIGACTGPQVAADPRWTPAVVLATPSADPALVRATPTPLDIATEEYQIRPGETLTGIAERYGLSVEELAALNGIGDPNSIRVGQRIRVPAAQP